MTYRLSIEWPDPAPFTARATPFRLLAVSDEVDQALHHEVNRAALAPVDLVLGCGDIEADDLCFLADAFGARLLYVLGNHDRGTRWTAGSARLPAPVHSLTEEAGLRIVGLSWPGHDASGAHAPRDGLAAWRDVAVVLVRLGAVRLRGRRPTPFVVISHAAPDGLGDGPDRYHAGFAAYRRLLEWLRPPLWLHGHTSLASAGARRVDAGSTAVVNVTGSVLIELRPPRSGAPRTARDRSMPDRAP